MRIRNLMTALCALLLAACTVTTPTTAGDGEQAARAVFDQLYAAARERDANAFKALIAPTDRAEMAAMEAEQPGLTAMLMELIAAGGDPASYRAEVGPRQVRFVRRVEQRDRNGSSSETTTVTLIRVGPAWMFGKPRP